MSLRVVTGGRATDPPSPEARSVTFSRQPRRPVALIIRDRGCMTLLAYDDGDPWEIVGIRELTTPAPAHVVNAWVASAKADGLEVRDERTPRPLLEGGISMAQAITLEQRRRDAKAGAAPAGDLPLFTADRDRRELF